MPIASKTFHRTPTLFSKRTCIVISLCTFLMTIWAFAFAGIESYWFYLCVGPFISFAFLSLGNALPSYQMYRYDEKHLVTLYNRLRLKEIPYSIIKGVSISNAVLMHRGGQLPKDLMFGERITYENGEREFLQYSYITLYSDLRFIRHLKPGISCLDLLQADSDIVLYGFVCQFSSLKELLGRIDADLYIIEDVFSRFRNEIRIAVNESGYDFEKVHIVSSGTGIYPNLNDMT